MIYLLNPLLNTDPALSVPSGVPQLLIWGCFAYFGMENHCLKATALFHIAPNMSCAYHTATAQLRDTQAKVKISCPARQWVKWALNFITMVQYPA